MSDKVSWEDIKNGKPLPQIKSDGSDGSGIKTEQRSGKTYQHFSLGKRIEKGKK